MFAIVQIGSHQYKIAEGDVISVQRWDEKDGKTLNLDQILLLSDGKTVEVGQPFLKDVKVSAKVVGQTLAPKVVSYRYRRRKDWDWKKGHRQKLTTLNITKISPS
ncbi:MAG: 50S ribosomal protein L21 [Candidatus Omnitrophota bacterium]